MDDTGKMGLKSWLWAAFPVSLLAFLLAAGAAWALAPEEAPPAAEPACHGHGPGWGCSPGPCRGGPFGEGGWQHHGRGLHMGAGPLAHLGRMPGDLALSDGQWDEIHEIMEEARQIMDPLEEIRAEKHDDLRKAMHANPLDEAAIRSASQALAAVQADLAVAHARTRARIMERLTPEQREYLEDFSLQRDRYREQWRDERRFRRFDRYGRRG